MRTGAELRNAICTNARIRAVNNCPGVSVAVGQAMYGGVQDDSGDGIKFERASSTSTIARALYFGGTVDQTSTWHFTTTGAVHHFVIVPWYNHAGTPGWAYTVLMAYENQYTVGGYIDRAGTAPGEDWGYREMRTLSDVQVMLTALLNEPAAWVRYFGQVGQHQATAITLWKYKLIALDTAYANVGNFR